MIFIFWSYKSIIISNNKYTIYIYICKYIKSNIVFYSLSDYKKNYYINTFFNQINATCDT